MDIKSMVMKAQIQPKIFVKDSETAGVKITSKAVARREKAETLPAIQEDMARVGDEDHLPAVILRRLCLQISGRGRRHFGEAMQDVVHLGIVEKSVATNLVETLVTTLLESLAMPVASYSHSLDSCISIAQVFS